MKFLLDMPVSFLLLDVLQAQGPGLILFRGGNYSDSEMCDLLSRVLEKVRPEVLEKSVCVVDRRRVRVTRLPFERKP